MNKKITGAFALVLVVFISGCGSKKNIDWRPSNVAKIMTKHLDVPVVSEGSDSDKCLADQVRYLGLKYLELNSDDAKAFQTALKTKVKKVVFKGSEQTLVLDGENVSLAYYTQEYYNGRYYDNLVASKKIGGEEKFTGVTPQGKLHLDENGVLVLQPAFQTDYRLRRQYKTYSVQVYDVIESSDSELFREYRATARLSLAYENAAKTASCREAVYFSEVQDLLLDKKPTEPKLAEAGK